MTKEVEVDVLVSGAGPTGLTLTLTLLRCGVPPDRVRIIDKAPTPNDQSRALGICSRVMEFFSHLGVAEEFQQHRNFTPTKAGCLYDRGNLIGELSILPSEEDTTPFDDCAFPPMCILPQFNTEEILSRAVEKAGVKIERGVELKSFKRTEDNDNCPLECTLSNGKTVTTNWLYGSDGAHSAVRKGAQPPVEFHGAAYGMHFLLADIKVNPAAPDCPAMNKVTVVMAPNRPASLFFPLGPDSGRWLAVEKWDTDTSTSTMGGSQDPSHGPQRGAETEASTYDRLLGLLSSINAPLPNLPDEPPIWVSEFKIHHRIASSYRRGRALIGGDAAHIHSPAGGQGMNTGISDAFNAGWRLALIAKGKAKSDLMDEYAEERLKVGEEILSLADSLTKGALGVRGGLSYWFTTKLMGAALALVPLSFRKRGFRVLAQLDRNYSGCSSIGPDDPSLKGKGMAPGWRVPPVGSDFASTLAFGEGGVGGMVLFVLNDQATAEEQTVLMAAAMKRIETLRSSFGDTLAYRLIVSASSSEENVQGKKTEVIVDKDGWASKVFSAPSSEGSIYFVRPDGYVGFRVAGVAAEGGTEKMKQFLGKMVVVS
uniref:FAD-binding domain-containing protein n=1 Tax=Chromera velia CCMP2878 TaxID=1169474 RepID=A0A0G4HKV6_9ALVE|eukprot:Cvel_28590.t1-p1 / transcript=Cvel_28590.t1 / gene=Cvel_28590 / organism=Chromera_velia_CCMP2878 / gene_product=Pentachlorophenol 4-monooxygenase, putative / transcript_product=Pentachlorophenol 4-monooxygenase, putative / location=Cvel_scaffold3770:8908-11199(-) / protein_length=595 / sequence_SO=supercontig / SO=protein_coding / is_pseudo=false